MIRSDHPEYTRSRPISEVKLDWAGPVLWTEMTREAPVTNLLPGDDMVKGPSHNFRNHEIQFDFLLNDCNEIGCRSLCSRNLQLLY